MNVLPSEMYEVSIYQGKIIPFIYLDEKQLKR